MDTYSSSWFSHIDYMFLLLIFPSLTFHDLLPLLSRSIPEYISPHTCTYSPLLICTIHASYLPCLESLASGPNLPLPLVHFVTPELAKLLITSISLHSTLKDSVLVYLDRPWCSHNNATCLLSEADVQRLCKKNAICEEHDGMLMDNLGRLYVPESNLLQMEVIHKHHDSLVARHPGYEKMLDLLQCNYYWPGMATTVKEYVTRCDTCQRFKGSNVAPAGLLHPLKTLSLPWEHISADFITDLPPFHSFDVEATKQAIHLRTTLPILARSVGWGNACHYPLKGCWQGRKMIRWRGWVYLAWGTCHSGLQGKDQEKLTGVLRQQLWPLYNTTVFVHVYTRSPIKDKRDYCYWSSKV